MQTDQWDLAENPEINLFICGPLYFDKDGQHYTEGTEWSFLQRVLDNHLFMYRGMKLDPYLTPHININSG